MKYDADKNSVDILHIHMFVGIMSKIKRIFCVWF